MLQRRVVSQRKTWTLSRRSSQNKGTRNLSREEWFEKQLLQVTHGRSNTSGWGSWRRADVREPLLFSVRGLKATGKVCLGLGKRVWYRANTFKQESGHQGHRRRISRSWEGEKPKAVKSAHCRCSGHWFVNYIVYDLEQQEPGCQCILKLMKRARWNGQE